MSDSTFNNAQHAFETITTEYRDHRDQGLSHTEAVDHIVQRHGLAHKRGRVVALINDYLADIVGQSGEQFTAVVSTPSTPVSAPAPVEVPDTLPEDWFA